ncbi:hypothetical protein GGR57DRAFT_69012 [Xylariaceae sp. FL1272]|nr:hypothetical protein GGR57DRAFT_69012 [Xylariaceae sp. FL1272]
MAEDEDSLENSWALDFNSVPTAHHIVFDGHDPYYGFSATQNHSNTNYDNFDLSAAPVSRTRPNGLVQVPSFRNDQQRHNFMNNTNGDQLVTPQVPRQGILPNHNAMLNNSLAPTGHRTTNAIPLYNIRNPHSLQPSTFSPQWNLDLDNTEHEPFPGPGAQHDTVVVVDSPQARAEQSSARPTHSHRSKNHQCEIPGCTGQFASNRDLYRHLWSKHRHYAQERTTYQLRKGHARWKDAVMREDKTTSLVI